MIIANPIYDTAFMRLMKNEHVKKFFIGTLLGQTVLSIEKPPQTCFYEKEDNSENAPSQFVATTLLLLDVIVIVRTETGEQRKVLVEIQRAWDKRDLWDYNLNYKSKYKIDGEEVSLPVINIYTLDFMLPNIESACLKIEHGGYWDMTSCLFVEAKSPLLEKLKHNSIIIQARITSERYQTDLDKLLSVFEQACFPYDMKTVKMFNHPIDDEDVKEMIDLLHYVGTDPEERRELEIEQEAIRVWKVSFAKVNRELEKNRKANEEKDKVIGEQKKVIEEKDKVIEELVKSSEAQANAIDAIKRQLDEMQRRSSEK
jgi:hypothetical protein